MDNQTEELWLMNASTDDKGTGLFASTDLDMLQKTAQRDARKIATFEFRHGAGDKVIVSDMGYQHCVKVGYNTGVIAFKWIPYLVAGEDMVIQSAKGCKGVQCVRRCAGYGCLCLMGLCK